MKLVIITDAWQPQVNGVVRTYENIISELKKEGHIVKVIGPDDFITFPLPFYPEIRLAFFPYRKMAKMINAFDPDGIHIPVEGPLGWSARAYCRRNKKAFTSSFHTHFPDYLAKRVPEFMQRFVYNFTVKIVKRFHSRANTMYVATKSLEQQLKEWGFQNQFVRLVRGVDTSIFYPAENKQTNQKPVLIYVGRVAVEKNIEVFLDMDIDADKIVVGIGPDLERLCKKYPHIEFAGLKQGKDLGDYYRKANCFVFPSKTDTFGIVLIEAMACGLPIAGYNVTGPKDLVTHEFLGAINDDLSMAVKKALSAPGTHKDRYNHALKNYSWKEVAKVFAAQYKSPSLKQQGL
jgi:glycosyltransferase involved in cell wall biosynthesis